jgi:hypothetical protein
MDPDLVDAVKQAAKVRGETFTDAMRRGALLYLGQCPTCGHEIERTAGEHVG